MDRSGGLFLRFFFARAFTMVQSTRTKKSLNKLRENSSKKLFLGAMARFGRLRPTDPADATYVHGCCTQSGPFSTSLGCTPMSLGIFCAILGASSSPQRESYLKMGFSLARWNGQGFFFLVGLAHLIDINCQ